MWSASDALPDIYDIDDVGKAQIVVALDKHHALSAVGIDLSQFGLQFGVRNIGRVDLVGRGRVGTIDDLNSNGAVLEESILANQVRRG